MTRTGKITIIAALAALAAVLPATAFAGPLLSGYGGPGQGNQAVLGSALLGGGSGSGGSGGGSATSGAAQASAGGAGESSGVSVSRPSQGSGTPRHAAPGAGSRRSHGRTGAAKPTHATPAPSSPVTFRGYTATQRARSSGPLLGLSGLDVVYIVLVLGVLVLTGVLTGRLAAARGPHAVRGSRGAA